MKKLTYTFTTLVIALFLFTVSASAQPVEALTNGDFENGDLSGWMEINTAGAAPNAAVLSNAVPGASDVLCGSIPVAPFSGSFLGLGSISAFSTPGEYGLYQDFSIPAGATNVQVNWASYLSILANTGFPKTINIEIRDLSNNTLQNLVSVPIPVGSFGSGPCIFGPGAGWVPGNIDITGSGFQGQTVRLAFVIVSTDFPGYSAFFGDIMIDEVSVTYTPGAPPAVVPTMSEWGLMILGLILLTMGTLVIRRRRVGAFI